jgi:hypothetical protein
MGVIEGNVFTQAFLYRKYKLTDVYNIRHNFLTL